MSEKIDRALTSIELEREQGVKTDEDFAAATAENEKMVEAFYSLPRNSRPDVGGQNLQSLAKKYGPTVVKWVGGPGAGIVAASFLADDGAFSSLTSVVGKVLGLFGLG